MVDGDIPPSLMVLLTWSLPVVMIIMIITNIHIAITSQVIDNEANLATFLPPHVTQPVSHCPPESRIIDHPSCQTRSVFPFCPRPLAFCLRSDSDDAAEGA